MCLLKTNCAGKKVLIILILILIVGSILRFYGLANQSLWNDELSSWVRSSHGNLSAVMEKGVYTDVHPPGYQLLLYFVEKYIGDSEAILRLPSALSGSLAILVIFLTGTRLYSHKEGLIAAVLMAVLWCPIYYSQEARSYSMLLLFTSMATYFWISLLQAINTKTKPSYYSIIGYIISSIIASYLHYFGPYLIALQAIATAMLAIRKHKAFGYVILLYLPILLAYMPWMPTMYKHLNQGPIWIGPPGHITKSFTGYLRFLFNQSMMIYIFALLMYCFLFLQSLNNILKFKKYKALETVLLSPGMLLILWLVVPFVGVYIKSVISAPVLTFRNLIISLPAAYLLLARSITQLPFGLKNKSILTCILATLFLAHLMFHMDYYSKPHKQQFREAVAFVAEKNHIFKDSLIIGYCHYGPAYLDYYFEKKGSDRRVNILAGQKSDIPLVVKALRSENPRYVWYIRAHKIPDAQFMNFLVNNLKCIRQKKFLGAYVWLFEYNQTR